MSVYTIVSEAAIQHFLEPYATGSLINHEGVGEGIENTNYFVDTDKGRYVLTLFEQMSFSDLPYFLDLMTYLAESGLPVPQPIADRNGDYLKVLCGKPATLITRLEGHTVQTPDAEQCRQLGATLGMMHTVTKGFKQNHTNQRNLEWCQQCGEKLIPTLKNKEAVLLMSELAHQQTIPMNQLPQGVIHADLFRDNALFNGENLTGLIDFYYACDGVLLYDLAVTVNDWCISTDGSLDPARYQALIIAYQQHRTFQKIEHLHWQDMLCRAALRFWLSRLQDKYFPRPGEITHIKDPDFFKDLLIQHKQQTPQLC